MNTTYSVAEVAERTGLSAHTLRYYERDGLMLAAVARSTSGHRAYTERDISWVTLLTRLRATGMPIALMKQYADLVRRGPGNEAERLDLLRRHRAAVLEQLAAITENLGAIDYKIGVYEESVSVGVLT